MTEPAASPAPGSVWSVYDYTAGGRVTVRWHCECGFVTGPCYATRGNAAEDEMRIHLALEHGMAPAGRCSVCQAPTDHFRAHVPDLGTDEWLCKSHAPELPVVLDQGPAA